MDPIKEPCLIVGDINNVDIDSTCPPTTGEEYIKRVVIEARQCHDVVVAKIDKAKLKKPTVDVKPKVIQQLAGCAEAPVSLLPTLEWQNCQAADFSDVRLRMARFKFERESRLDWKNTQPNLPSNDDHESWLTFCFGSTDKDIQAHHPTLNIVTAMAQPLIEQVLEYLVEEVEKQGAVSFELGQWLYALLAALELPLNPDICSCLRTLARACSKARASLISTDDSVAKLNLFISLVARYFRQLDLADS